MRAPAIAAALLSAALLLLPTALAGCAADGSGGGGGASPPASAASPPSRGPAGAPDAGAPVAGADVMAGWIDLRESRRTGGRLTSLTLVSETREEGRLMKAGRAVMDGGKVVDAATAASISSAFDQAGFRRFSLSSRPTEGPSGAMQVVWIDRGEGIESLFLLPGARQDPRTEDLPDVFQAVKYLVFRVHQETPGSMVLTGEGWSGDDMMNQRPERPRR